MARLEEYLPLSEEIIWRWPEPASRFSRIFTFVMLAIGFAGAFWLWEGEGYDEELVDRIVETLLVGLLPLLAAGFSDRASISALALTPYWVAVARGKIFRKVEALEKREIFRATVWESGGRAILHRPDGKSLQVTSINKIDEMIDALGLPTLLWRQRKSSGVAAGILIFALFLAFALWQAGLFAVMLTVPFDGLSTLVPQKWLRLILFIGALPFIFGLPALVALLASGFVAVLLARIGGREVLESVVRAAGDPAWDGKRRRPGAIFRTLNLMVRLTGAAPVMPDRAMPEVQNGPLPKFHTGKRRRRWPSRR